MSDRRRSPDDFLVFGAPRIEQEEIDEVVACLESGWLGTGPRVRAFEEAFAAYSGAGYPVAVNSCTAALHLCLASLELKPGDEVITTPMTFCATVNAIIHAGGTPVVVDVDARTMNLDPAAVEAAVSPRTRALLPVHMAGRPCDMAALNGIATRHGLTVIEDCAHAIESTIDGQKTGTFGDFGCFSFYVTKNVVTGEGGMVLARDEAVAQKIRTLSLHGMDKDAWKRFSASGYRHYEVVAAGFKYNMMDIQAAIGLHQLRRVEANLVRRQAVWRIFDEDLHDIAGLTLPSPPRAGTRHALHLYTVLVDEAECGVGRDAFLEGMRERHIGVGVHYRAVNEYEFYQQRYGWRPEDTPNATRIGRQTVSLPLSPAMTEDDARDVTAAVRDLVG